MTALCQHAPLVAELDSPDGESPGVLLLSPVMESPIWLENTALMIWDEFSSPASVAEAVASLSEKTGASAEEISPQVVSFTEQLIDLGLLEMIGAGNL